MILKILSRHTAKYSALIKYLLKQNSSTPTHVFTHNLRSYDPTGWAKEFAVNETFRKRQRSNKTYFYHTIISFSKNEMKRLSGRELEDIGRKYISLHGADGVYLAAVHEDKQHAHIHIMASGVRYRTGDALRLTQADLSKLKVALQKYHLERYPHITNSTVSHGSGRNVPSDKEFRARMNRRELNKERIAGILNACIRASRSISEFMERIQKQDIRMYQRNGKPVGVMFEGRKYRFSTLGFTTHINSLAFKELERDIER
jgi:hypothetical protein